MKWKFLNILLTTFDKSTRRILKDISLIIFQFKKKINVSTYFVVPPTHMSRWVVNFLKFQASSSELRWCPCRVFSTRLITTLGIFHRSDFIFQKKTEASHLRKFSKSKFQYFKSLAPSLDNNATRNSSVLRHHGTHAEVVDERQFYKTTNIQPYRTHQSSDVNRCTMHKYPAWIVERAIENFPQ